MYIEGEEEEEYCDNFRNPKLPSFSILNDKGNIHLTGYNACREYVKVQIYLSLVRFYMNERVECIFRS